MTEYDADYNFEHKLGYIHFIFTGSIAQYQKNELNRILSLISARRAEGV